jgi:hypothetical protein
LHGLSSAPDSPTPMGNSPKPKTKEQPLPIVQAVPLPPEVPLHAWSHGLKLSPCSSSWFEPDQRRAWSVSIDPKTLTAGGTEVFGLPCGCSSEPAHLGGIFAVQLRMLPKEARTADVSHSMAVMTAGKCTNGIACEGRVQRWRTALDSNLSGWGLSVPFRGGSGGQWGSPLSSATLPNWQVCLSSVFFAGFFVPIRVLWWSCVVDLVLHNRPELVGSRRCLDQSKDRPSSSRLPLVWPGCDRAI